MKKALSLILILCVLINLPGCKSIKVKEKLVGQWAQKKASVMTLASSFGGDLTSVDFYVYEFNEDSSLHYTHYTADNAMGFWTIRTNEVSGKFSIGNGIITLKCSHEKVITQGTDGRIINEHENNDEWATTLKYTIDPDTSKLVLEPDEKGTSKYNYYSTPENGEELWKEAIRNLS